MVLETSDRDVSLSLTIRREGVSMSRTSWRIKPEEQKQKTTELGFTPWFGAVTLGVLSVVPYYVCQSSSYERLNKFSKRDALFSAPPPKALRKLYILRCTNFCGKTDQTKDAYYMCVVNDYIPCHYGPFMKIMGMTQTLGRTVGK